MALVHADDSPLGAVLAAAAELRGQGRAVTAVPRRKKLGSQLDELQARGYDRFVVFDPDQPVELRSFSDA